METDSYPGEANDVTSRHLTNPLSEYTHFSLRQTPTGPPWFQSAAPPAIASPARALCFRKPSSSHNVPYIQYRPGTRLALASSLVGGETGHRALLCDPAGNPAWGSSGRGDGGKGSWG